MPRTCGTVAKTRRRVDLRARKGLPGNPPARCVASAFARMSRWLARPGLKRGATPRSAAPDGESVLAATASSSAEYRCRRRHGPEGLAEIATAFPAAQRVGSARDELSRTARRISATSVSFVCASFTRVTASSPSPRQISVSTGAIARRDRADLPADGNDWLARLEPARASRVVPNAASLPMARETGDGRQ